MGANNEFFSWVSVVLFLMLSGCKSTDVGNFITSATDTINKTIAATRESISSSAEAPNHPQPDIKSENSYKSAPKAVSVHKPKKTQIAGQQNIKPKSQEIVFFRDKSEEEAGLILLDAYTNRVNYAEGLRKRYGLDVAQAEFYKELKTSIEKGLYPPELAAKLKAVIDLKTDEVMAGISPCYSYLTRLGSQFNTKLHRIMKRRICGFVKSTTRDDAKLSETDILAGTKSTYSGVELPQTYVEEANKFNKKCATIPKYYSFHNCTCLTNSVLHQRILNGPDEQQPSLLLAKHNCYDASVAAGAQYQKCQHRGFLYLVNHVSSELEAEFSRDMICACKAHTFEQLFNTGRAGTRDVVRIQSLSHRHCSKQETLKKFQPVYCEKLPDGKFGSQNNRSLICKDKTI